VDGQLAPRLTQDATEARIEVQAVGSEVELLLRDVPGVDPGGNLLGGHGFGGPP
jgi:hypothetical protein